MLVIKMLKKASGLNNQELAEFLGKSRNTISSWEKDESTIPETEKKKINEKFNILPFYWNIGLDESDELYREMYQKIKLGYELSLRNTNKIIDDPVERILFICEQREEKSGNKELEHYIYIQTLRNGKDPITGQLLEGSHFINNLIIKKSIMDLCDNIECIFEEKYVKNNYERDNSKKEKYITLLKTWRNSKAVINNMKAFQIISDSILLELVDNYVKYNNPLEKRVKNFPVGGLKYQMYYEEILKLLEENNYF